MLITFTDVGARVTYFGITIDDVMRLSCVGFRNNQRLVAQDLTTRICLHQGLMCQDMRGRHRRFVLGIDKSHTAPHEFCPIQKAK